MLKRMNTISVWVWTLLLTCCLNAKSMRVSFERLNEIEKGYRYHLGHLNHQLSHAWTDGMLWLGIKAKGKTHNEYYGARILKASHLYKQNQKDETQNWICTYKKDIFHVPAIIETMNELVTQFDIRCEAHGRELTPREKSLLFYQLVHEFQLQKLNLPQHMSFEDLAHRVENKQVDINLVSENLLIGMGVHYHLGLPD